MVIDAVDILILGVLLLPGALAAAYAAKQTWRTRQTMAQHRQEAAAEYVEMSLAMRRLGDIVQAECNRDRAEVRRAIEHLSANVLSMQDQQQRQSLRKPTKRAKDKRQ